MNRDLARACAGRSCYPAGVMSRKLYLQIVFLSAPLPIAGAWALGRPIAARLAALDAELTTVLALLGWLLGLLGAVIAWAIVLSPLRKAAGFLPIREEVAGLREAGLVQSIAREQAELRRQANSEDPEARAGHHGTMTLVGGGLSVAAWVLCWALLRDGFIVFLPAALALACPLLTLYHLARWARARRAARRRSPT